MTTMVSDSGGGTFTPHPKGQHYARCVDVHDVGEVQTRWGSKRKVDIYFYAGHDKHDELGNLMEDDRGRPIRLLLRARFTATLHENGNLRPFLERWRGQEFTAEELKGFDLDRLIGVPALIQVTHRRTDTTTFANIDSIMKLPRGAEAPAIPEDYIRIRDRVPEEQPQEGGGSWRDEDDDLPF